ncbi:MAG TPA: aldo/keto reductase [Steroidobacteraceae bacterium]|nr:aldo/keto reductase [Steroidobacteraceae bacterium]
MQYTTLGRTGLRVSVAGLGCGGNSRLGLGADKGEDDAVALVRAAIELGVNFFDTAEAYGTERVLGRALAGVARDSVVVSSKSRILGADGNLLTGAALVENLEKSLRRLSLDHVDVFHLHAVLTQHYDYALHELVPSLLKQRDKGTIRHLGITESPPRDPDQAMLQRALDDSCWDVVMLAFHMMNQGPRNTVFPRTRAQRVGTLIMFAVRNIFSRPGVLERTLKELAAKAEVSQELADQPDPLGFLVHEGGASNVTDAAYRFARHEPGADVILFGTGDQEHLRANVASLEKPALPPADLEKLRVLFAHLRGVGLVFPDKPASRGRQEAV